MLQTIYNSGVPSWSVKRHFLPQASALSFVSARQQFTIGLDYFGDFNSIVIVTLAVDEFVSFVSRYNTGKFTVAVIGKYIKTSWLSV